jgi:uncharacterized lipoprotein YmbA
MSKILKLPSLALLGILAACRSDPVHYHTLTPLQAGPARTMQTSGNLAMERLTVPPQVDRTQLVVRQGNNGLAILETDWWGASLSDELQSALVDQLNHRQFNDKVSLRVQIQRFDLVPGRYALLEAKWRLRTALPDRELRELHCQTVLQVPAGGAVEDLVTAQQRNLEKLAAMITESSRGGCPDS